MKLLPSKLSQDARVPRDPVPAQWARQPGVSRPAARPRADDVTRQLPRLAPGLLVAPRAERDQR